MASKIPGGGGYVKLNSAGIREMMKSQEVINELEKRMSRVQGALPGSTMVTKMRPSRAVVQVAQGNDFDEANSGNLSRALDLAGGKRGTKIKTQKKTRRG
jgi:hypothetical protein